MAENKQADQDKVELEPEENVEQKTENMDEETLNDPEETEALSKQDKELDELKKEKEEQYNRMLRIQAEFDNFKRRTEKERVAERKYQAQDLANELLPVLDNFERALQVESSEETSSIIKGITMVYNQFVEALKSQGVEEISTVGEQFDPNLHHAVMQVEEDEFESNEIVEELQKGYMLKDRVLRPSMVKVNK